jgi:large subunit ribosomal protein L29
MAKKGTSKEDLHAMSVPELEARLRETQESHFRLRFQHASTPIKNPLQLRSTRRQIARILTVLKLKQGAS